MLMYFEFQRLLDRKHEFELPRSEEVFNFLFAFSRFSSNAVAVVLIFLLKWFLRTYIMSIKAWREKKVWQELYAGEKGVCGVVSKKVSKRISWLLMWEKRTFLLLLNNVTKYCELAGLRRETLSLPYSSAATQKGILGGGNTCALAEFVAKKVGF